MLLKLTTDDAKEIVRRYSETKDGRAAWLQLHKEVLPEVPKTRVDALRDIVNFKMDSNSLPEAQLNKLDILIKMYESATSLTVSRADRMDYYTVALGTVEGDIFAHLVHDLESSSIDKDVWALSLIHI